MESDAPTSREQVLEALRQADGEGIKLATLTRVIFAPGVGVRPTKEAKAETQRALRELLVDLEAAGEVVNLGTAKTPCYLLPEFDRRLDWACATLEGKETPGRATLYNAAALRKGHRKGVTRPIVERAFARLLETGRLIEVRPGRSAYYLHARSILPLIPPDLLSAGAAGDHKLFSSETVRAAYDTLTREIGFADVPIADLQGRSAAPLDALHAWLREESRAGRAVPTRGDWSLAAESARAAALHLRGEPHLQIRLL